MALDIALLMQFEVGEAAEPGGDGRGGSSTMPHKRNPTACMLAIAAAKRTPGLLADFLAGMVQEHERAVGGWQAEWATVHAIVQSAGVALESMAEVAEGLTVDAARMRHNIEATHGAVFAEKADDAAGARNGTRSRAAHGGREHSPHGLSAGYARTARTGGISGQRGSIPPAPARRKGIIMPFADSQGCRIYYRLEGRPRKPLLVLVHSLGADHGMWDPQMPALLRRFQVLRLDLRGHGASDAPAGDYTIAQFGRDVLATVDAAGRDRFAYCGLSLGGMIGQWLGANARRAHRAHGPGEHVAANGRPQPVRDPARHRAGTRDARHRRRGDAALLLRTHAGLRKSGRGVRSRRAAGDQPGRICRMLRRHPRHGQPPAARPHSSRPRSSSAATTMSRRPGRGTAMCWPTASPARVPCSSTPTHLSNVERPSSFTAALFDFLLPRMPEDTLRGGLRGPALRARRRARGSRDRRTPPNSPANFRR